MARPFLTWEQKIALRRPEGWVVRRDAYGRVRLYDVVCSMDPEPCIRYYGDRDDNRTNAIHCEHFRFGNIRVEIPIWPSRKCLDVSAEFRAGDSSPGSRQLALAILCERFDWPVAREMYERFHAEIVKYRSRDWHISRADLDTFWAMHEDRKMGELEAVELKGR